MVEGGPLAGTRVAVEPHVACGRCVCCEAGNPNLCLNHCFAGQAPQDAARREWMCWPEAFVFPSPILSLMKRGVALWEPLGVALHTVNLGKLRGRMRVGV
ncbi:MAG: alcohol dehydrogenase catalytic domain-containing protein [Anaerolineae bacterium]|nr:alcohol dehydrogenase catalytic domain-containing protein [Anaerolineae bacterium]